MVSGTRTVSRVVLLIFSCCVPSLTQDGPIHSLALARCIESRDVRSSVTLDMSANPYYLRGDFDSDGVPDYAVVVRGINSKKKGIVICTRRRRDVILGAETRGAKAFSDMPGDNFVAPHWEVATRADVLALRRTNDGVPDPKGESIFMVWEDGLHIIYWDGSGYRWSQMMQ